jgi:hypothetical protein
VCKSRMENECVGCKARGFKKNECFGVLKEGEGEYCTLSREYWYSPHQ